MSDFWQDPNDDGDSNEKPNPLRAHLKKLEDENKTLKKQHEDLLSQVRKNTVQSVIAAKGFSPKVASLIPSDVEATAEAIDKWLSDFGEVLAPMKKDDGEPPEGEPDPESQAQQDQMAKIAGATNAARSAGTVKAEEIMAKLRSKNLTRDELVGMINGAGGGFGSG